MKRRIKLIWRFAKPHKYKFIILLISIIVTTFSGSLYPLYFWKIVDEAFYEKTCLYYYSIIILYGVVFLFNQIIRFVLNTSWANLMTRFLYDIRKAIFSKIIS